MSSTHPDVCSSFKAHPKDPNSCDFCWLKKATHSQKPAFENGWLDVEWQPAQQPPVPHSSPLKGEVLTKLVSLGADKKNVEDIGQILYDEFHLLDIPVPSYERVIDKDRFVKCFQQFYEQLFKDGEMMTLFEKDVDGFGGDLSPSEHGIRLGRFCLWRICGDKKYPETRAGEGAESRCCPVSAYDKYTKLGPGHVGAKKAGGHNAFTAVMRNRWLGHQWCAWTRVGEQDLAEFVIPWLASIIDLYGPFPRFVGFLENTAHSTYLGACYRAEDLLKGTCVAGSDAKPIHGVFCFKGKKSRCGWQIEDDGGHIYLKNTEHGTYLGACFQAEDVLKGTCVAGSDAKPIHGVFLFEGKDSRCRWQIENEDGRRWQIEDDGGHIYLKNTDHETYLGACFRGEDIHAGNAAHGTFCFKGKQDRCKWQQSG